VSHSANLGSNNISSHKFGGILKGTKPADLPVVQSSKLD
jgi:hypothetical protein